MVRKCGFVNTRFFRRGYLLTALVLFLAWSSAVKAHSAVYSNPNTGYRVIVEDDAELLSGPERSVLAEKMEPITAYGNAAFKTIGQNSTSAGKFAESYYAELFSGNSGILFLIDMDNRKIWIHCNGAIYRTINKNYADTITDNVYTYASDGDYYMCASKAFEQALTLLKGHKIAQPMKYICNALLAVICALLLNFGFVNFFSRARGAGDRELLAHMDNRYSHTKPKETYLSQTKVYNPVSSGGGGGHGHGGGGGRGGGGGHGF